jgi:cell division transport system ATP-binding protein
MTVPTSAQEKNKAMVGLIKVGKSYPPDVEALNEISLTIRKGEMVFLTGRSGAGKTTLLRLLCHIERPDRGLVEIDGTDLGSLAPARLQRLRRRIGMAYQDFKLLTDNSVAENIALPMEVLCRQKSFIRRRTKELLEALGLAHKFNARAGDLSRGEQQRVSIARAVANNPDLILADEPTGNLDVESTARVMDLFHEHCKRGAAILIATHDPKIYAGGNFRILHLADGEVIEQFSPSSTADEVDTA